MPTGKWIVPSWSRATIPESEVGRIAKSEVPDAMAAGCPKAMWMSGTMTIPPPMPNIAERMPTHTPQRATTIPNPTVISIVGYPRRLGASSSTVTSSSAT